jgi:glycosyltransferase involved in cell wall biosynthesis
VSAFSLVIPVYRNAASLDDLLGEVENLFGRMRQSSGIGAEAIFVVDGSPDDSYDQLAQRLPTAPFRSKLLLHSRNFGPFAAMRSGMQVASGDYIGVMAADLQEPTSLQERFVACLATGDHDVVVGARVGRDDPAWTRLTSAVFWWTYRLLVNGSIPPGGVDVFACNRRFRDELLRLDESNTSMIALIFWLGFRRAEVPYQRVARRRGKSASTFQRRLTYLLDSVFAFTDLPVRLLMAAGALGLMVAVLGGSAVVLTRIIVGIPVPGYTATVLTLLFFGGLNALGLGIVGNYAWRGFENTKGRPVALVMRDVDHAGTGIGHDVGDGR